MQQTTEKNLAKFTRNTDHFEEFAKLIVANHEEWLEKRELKK